MNNEEELMANLIFKNRIYEYNGQNFQDFFVKIMIAENSDFKPVKAWGNVGDQKNDGFDFVQGTYYQVFAPEEITKNSTINEAVKKLEEDFVGLYNFWNDKTEIKNFNFVINDKFKGCAPQIYSKLSDLQRNESYKHIKFNLFLAEDLRKKFMELDKINKENIIGLMPCHVSSLVEYDALNQTVDYLLNLEIPKNGNGHLIVPDFYKKIKFNKLNKSIKDKLVSANYQEGELIKYFKEHPEIKELLRNKFNNLYEESKNIFDESIENYSNLRFIHILETACCENTLAIQTSVLVLMAHYFESCDIFEEPDEEFNDDSIGKSENSPEYIQMRLF